MKPFNKTIFAAVVRARREFLNITSEELADQIGTTRRSLSDWENPNSPKMPQDFTVLGNWCDALGLTFQEALTGTPMPEINLFKDPYQLAAKRVFYTRYTRHKEFAELIHKLMACNDDAINSLNHLTSILSSLEMKDVNKLNERWALAFATPEQDATEHGRYVGD